MRRKISQNSLLSSETLETLRSCEADIGEKCGSPLTGYFSSPFLIFVPFQLNIYFHFKLARFTRTLIRNATKKAELEACMSLADNFKSGRGSDEV